MEVLSNFFALLLFLFVCDFSVAFLSAHNNVERHMMLNELAERCQSMY